MSLEIQNSGILKHVCPPKDTFFKKNSVLYILGVDFCKLLLAVPQMFVLI